MEGIENPPSNLSTLMRFSFEPNEQLLEETQKLVEESKRARTSIRYYASRQLLLPASQFKAHEGSLHRIGRAFRANNEPIHLAPQIRSRNLSEGLTRFQFLAADQQSFDDLTSLVVSPETKFDNYTSYEHDSLQQLPNEIENQPLTGHYLFVDIATDSLIGEKKRRMAENTFKSKASKGSFFVHALALSAIRDIYHVARPPENRTHYYFGDNDELSRAV